mmetsp:Transcript_19783/g.40869  ORF Transcript_19783/g.40869 Transcript_19783/m.40869 type:complete len:286 (-) Transcript_19783:357-1214(-)
METFIDVVSFLDIFFWFFTGDLETSTGHVIPKAFFGRCILPGTLVQVLDHPTLPEVLPSLLGRLAETASDIGWSRVARWICALVPALAVVLVRPLCAYFFRHLDEESLVGGFGGGGDDLLMSYAESFGYLPTRSSQLLDTAVNPLWSTRFDGNLRGSRSNLPSSEGNNYDASSSGEEGDGDKRADGGGFEAGHCGRSFGTNTNSQGDFVIVGIRTPPTSPRRGALRGSTTTRSPRFESGVRFANDTVTGASAKDDDDDYGNSLVSSTSDFNIGLSLSSHALDDWK